MKRLFDISFSFVAICLLWPVFAIAAVLIKFGDHGPVFFSQERVGLCGRTFRILKFRTMVVNAERLGLPLTSGDDRRITTVGRWLRKTKLDELPQLINVLRGEMSLVGPRPEVPKYVALYTNEQRSVLNCKPGITDPASLEYFSESELLQRAVDAEEIYVTQIMPAKIAMNLQYLGTASLRSDLVIIARTALRVCGWHKQQDGRHAGGRSHADAETRKAA